MLLFALMLGCSQDVEGDEAGECSDGADNDQNGYFDCVDLSCANSPDCAEEGDADTDADSDTDTDSDTDADTDTDTDADTDADTDTDTDTDADSDADLSALATYEVEMVVRWTFPSGGYPDCELVYNGTGDQVENVPGRVSFFGDYTRSSSTCTEHATIEANFPWYDRTTGQAYVSFVFTGNGTMVDEWYADASETEFRTRADWQMYDMSAPYDDEAMFVRYSEAYADPSGYFAVTYEVEIGFGR